MSVKLSAKQIRILEWLVVENRPVNIANSRSTIKALMDRGLVILGEPQRLSGYRAVTITDAGRAAVEVTQ